MLPHKHFLISSAAAVPFALATPGWILISGFVSAAVDLDVIALVWLRSGNEERLKQFRDPAAIFCRFDAFMDAITETGVLKTAMKTHLVSCAVILALAALFWQPHFAPLAAGVAAHLLSDVPNVIRLRRAGSRAAAE